jgi:hypothetical protein
MRHIPSQATARRGVAVVMVVGCLAAFSVIALAMLRGAVIARHSFRSEHHLRQVELLLDAAVARTATRLASIRPEAPSPDADTLAEELLIPASEITGGHDAAIRITAEPADDTKPVRWRVRAVASYPIDGPHAVRRSREILLTIPPPSDQPDQPPSKETLP